MAKTITDAELEVMRILWREGRPVTFAEIKDELERTKGLSKSTVNTHISRLRDKGVVTHLDKYGAAQYYPLVTEDEYIHTEQNAVIEKLGGARKFMAAMVRNGHLREEDIDELREYFKMGGGCYD